MASEARSASALALWTNACSSKDAATLLALVRSSLRGKDPLSKVLTTKHATEALKVEYEVGHVGLLCAMLGLFALQPGFDENDDRRRRKIAFIGACERGHLGVVRFLLSLPSPEPEESPPIEGDLYHLGFDAPWGNVNTSLLLEVFGMVRPRAKDGYGVESGFQVACECGHVDIVCELLALSGKRAINVCQRDEEGPEAAFRNACAHGRACVVRELLKLEGDTHSKRFFFHYARSVKSNQG